MNKSYSIQCPDCKKVRWLGKCGYYKAKRNGAKCRPCACLVSNGDSDKRKNNSLLFAGRILPPLSQEARNKISIANSNPTDEIRKRKSIAQINRMKRNGITGFRSSNRLATHVFSGINKRMGWDGQYAGHHLGEKTILQYSLDYYLEHPDGYILVIEFDEPHHLFPKATAYDTKRQKEIEEFLGQTCIFLRYNEKTADWRGILK